MGFIKVINTGIQVLLTLVAGWFCARYKFLDGPEFSRKLNEFILKVLAPAFSIWLIGIKTDMRDVEAWRLIWVYMVWNTTLQVLVGLYVLVADRKRQARAFGLHTIVVAYNNTGIIGMVMGEAVLGPDMASLGLIISIPMFLQQVVTTMFCFEWDKQQQATLPLPVVQTKDDTLDMAQEKRSIPGVVASLGAKKEVLSYTATVQECSLVAVQTEAGVEAPALRRSSGGSKLGNELSVELAPVSFEGVYVRRGPAQLAPHAERFQGKKHQYAGEVGAGGVPEQPAQQVGDGMRCVEESTWPGSGHGWDGEVDHGSSHLITAAVVADGAGATTSRSGSESHTSSSSILEQSQLAEAGVSTTSAARGVAAAEGRGLGCVACGENDILDHERSISVMVVRDGGNTTDPHTSYENPLSAGTTAEGFLFAPQDYGGRCAVAGEKTSSYHHRGLDGDAVADFPQPGIGSQCSGGLNGSGVSRAASMKGLWSPSFQRIKSFKPHRGASSRLSTPASPRQPPSPRSLIIAQAAHIGLVVFSNPLLLFTIISVIMSLAGAPSILDPNRRGYIPGLGWIELTLGWLARTISPLSVFAQGLWLHGKVKQVATEPIKVSMYMAIKLVVGPALMVLLTLYCGLSDRYSVGLIIMTTLPVGQIAWVLSEQYKIGTEAVTAVMLLGMATMLPHVLIMLKIIDHFHLFDYKQH